ncbi:MAG TPA: ATP-grasp domain-containing protein [Vicinamibacteria bacterium]|nr:ATP-grasp domain-containing protein [Vicinamibacteria bacterium]
MSVIVLFGGDGTEHRVSVASAQNLAQVLEDAALWYWRRDGSLSSVSRLELLRFEKPFEADFAPAATSEWPDLPTALSSSPAENATFFLALHGGSGENGTVQALLESRGLAFTGSGSESSRLAFDKNAARNALRARGARVADGEILTSDSATHERVGRLFERHEKIVLKPVADGSSHGLRVITTERELSDAIAAVRRSEVDYLAEAFVAGRELTIGIVERSGETIALPCSEVILESGRTFDYEGKYLGRGSLEVTPAEVPPDVASSAQAVARIAHATLGCVGYSRTDVILSREGVVFLELNTLPGLTRASFIPQQLGAAGIPLRGFVADQLEIARRRRPAQLKP